MNLNLYDQDMNRISAIGNQYISCLWSEGYNTVENFTVELIATDEYKRKLRPDCYVGRDDRKSLMVIKTVMVSGGKLVASGKQAARVLDDVAYIGVTPGGISVRANIKYNYESTGKYRNLEVAESDLEDIYNHQISNMSMLKLCTTVCQDTDVGFRVVRSGIRMLLELYKPSFNPNLVYARKYGNLLDESVQFSTENLKNYAVVLGSGEGADRVKVIVDETNGADRRELIVDAKDLQPEEGESDDGYRYRLASRGNEKLLECRETLQCAFSPYAGDFGTRFDLGDILTVYLTDYGMKLQARVARFTQKSQKNKTTTTIEVGKITILR